MINNHHVSEQELKQSLHTEAFMENLAKAKLKPALKPRTYFLKMLPLILLTIAIIIFVSIGFRESILTLLMSDFIHNWQIWYKIILPLGLGTVGFTLLIKRTQPTRSAFSRGDKLWSLIIATLALVGVLYQLSSLQQDHWFAAIIGTQLWNCIILIPILGAPILIILFYMLRKFAPSNLAQTGFFAGLVAGGISAFLYGFHCPNDSALFTFLWHGLGILSLTLIGRLTAPTFLKW